MLDGENDLDVSALSRTSDCSLRTTAAANLLYLKGNRNGGHSFEVPSTSIPCLVEENDSSAERWSTRTKESLKRTVGSTRMADDTDHHPILDEKYPTEISVFESKEKRWERKTNDMTAFEAFVDACIHEISGENIAESSTQRSDLIPRRGLIPFDGIETIERSLQISLVPASESILSEYNLILTQNIEFFEVQTKYKIAECAEGFDIDDLPTSKVGLRCIHCSHEASHATIAAKFFPNTVGSIASGLGTIGARHLAAGNCSFLSNVVLEQMRSAKTRSQQQTRVQGTFGLEAYCRDLAQRYAIVEHLHGGIQIREVSYPRKDISQNLSLSIAYASPNVTQNNETKASQKSICSFVRCDIEHFWQCTNCRSLPFQWRASGSVIFCATSPSLDMVKKHESICQGGKPLRIPRNAVIESSTFLEKDCKVRVRWGQCNDIIRKSHRIAQAGAPKSKVCADPSLTAKIQVYDGLEDTPLIHHTDKELTTEFAFFTVMQLKKCYLTKTGGSRGSCPIGYPGLACVHCAGLSSERRFFYTSADHLRNSFSHIPAHLASCTACPDEVKKRIEAYKSLRNHQKSLLKAGLHKQFIDLVWERLHGRNDGTDTRKTATEGDAMSDDESISSVSVTSTAESRDDKLDLSDGAWFDDEDMTIDFTTSILFVPSDRQFTTDYTLFSFMQLVPMRFNGTSTSVSCTFCHKADFNVDYIESGNNSELVISMNEDGSTGDASVFDDDSDSIPKIAIYMFCKYCINQENSKSFAAHSADDLSKISAEIPEHLFTCSSCPEAVKTKLRRCKGLHVSQGIRHKSDKAFMNMLWARITSSEERQVSPSKVPSVLLENGSLLSEQDRGLVSDYTYFTMLQMIPCSLEHSGNGARSMFEYGFPGLACVHCAGTSSARKFFYRTAEILAGNYAHIPNHLQSCKYCPLLIKATLEEKKRAHMSQKTRLNRGSQRLFFNNIWTRLHRNYLSL